MFNLFKKNNQNNEEMTDFLLEQIKGHESYQSNDIFDYDIEKIAKVLKPEEKVTTKFDLDNFEDYLDFIKLYDSPFYLYRNFAEETQPYFSFYTEIESIKEVSSKDATNRIVDFYKKTLVNHARTSSEKDKVKKLIKLYKNKFKNFDKKFNDSIDNNYEEFQELKKTSLIILEGLASIHSSNQRENKENIISVIDPEKIISEIIRDENGSMINAFKEDIMSLFHKSLEDDIFFDFALFLIIFKEKARKENNREDQEFNRNVVLDDIFSPELKIIVLHLANIFLYNVIFVKEKNINSKGDNFSKSSIFRINDNDITINFPSSTISSYPDGSKEKEGLILTLESKFNEVNKILIEAMIDSKLYDSLTPYLYDLYQSGDYRNPIYSFSLNEDIIKRLLKRAMIFKNYEVQKTIYDSLIPSIVEKGTSGYCVKNSSLKPMNESSNKISLSQDLFMELITEIIAYSDLKALEIIKSYYKESDLVDLNLFNKSVSSVLFQKISNKGIRAIEKQISESICSALEVHSSKDLKILEFIEKDLGINISYERIIQDIIKEAKNKYLSVDFIKEKNKPLIVNQELDKFFANKVAFIQSNLYEDLLVLNFNSVFNKLVKEKCNFEYKDESRFPTDKSFKIFVENMTFSRDNFSKLFVDLSFNFRTNRIKILADFLENNDEKMLDKIINIVSEDGYNCLNYAIFEDETDLAEVLLDYGVNVNFIDDEGDTAITLIEEKIEENKGNDHYIKLKELIYKKGYCLTESDIEGRVNLNEFLTEISSLETDNLSDADKINIGKKFSKLFIQKRLIEFLEIIFDSREEETIEKFKALWFDKKIQSNKNLDMKKINSYIIEELV